MASAASFGICGVILCNCITVNIDNFWRKSIYLHDFFTVFAQFLHYFPKNLLYLLVMGSFERLENAKDCHKVAASHRAAQEFYRERHDRMEACVNAVRGKIYSEAELKKHRKAKREPVVINKILSLFRTLIGALVNSKFDASFMPMEDSDQQLAEVLSKLAVFDGKRNDDENQNAQVYQNAYITGRGYRMCWVEQGREGQPRVKSKVLNAFAVYFDPDSTDVITRNDAQFVDVVHWLSYDELLKAFPDIEGKINIGDKKDRNFTDSYDFYDKSSNRKHEDTEELNGKRQVIERYYRVSKNGKEELWLACWAPGLLGDDSFLYNGPYHVQAIDPDTGRAMFPIVELVSDNIMGESDGFVEFLKDPSKVVSSLFTQLLEGARHTGTGYLVDDDSFATKQEADRFKEQGANANGRFSVRHGMASGAVTPIRGNETPQINLQAMSYAERFMEDISSTTPAMQGKSESATTAASLNAQRLEQSSIQVSVFFAFCKRYLQQILKLRYAYWRETYTEELTIRLTVPQDQGGGQEQVMLNQMAPVVDQYGMPTGEIQKINDISAAEYDVVIDESLQSPTYRDKMVKVLGEMLQNPAMAQNPDIAMVLIEGMFDYSEVPFDMKQKFRRKMEQKAQMEQMMAFQQPIQGVA
jgi:hypothetical protein